MFAQTFRDFIITAMVWSKLITQTSFFWTEAVRGSRAKRKFCFVQFT